MTKKLSLDVDKLEVQSFATLAASDARGTVLAHETEAGACPTYLDCSTPSYCVCDPESTIECGGTDDTWYYSCDATMGVCPSNTCPESCHRTCP